MVPEDSVALQLRFREHEGGDEPPDVDAFARRGPRSTEPPLDAGALAAASSSDRAEPIGVLPNGTRLAPNTPFVMFFRHTGHGIPAPGSGGVAPLDLSSWSLSPTVFGWLASVTPPRRGALRSRAAWIAAACLPLVLSAEAMAAPRPVPPPVQVPEPGSASEASPEPQADDRPDSAASEPTTSEAAEPVPSETALEPVPPPAPMPALEGGPALDQATIDAAWEGVDGYDVELELKGGGTMRGRVGAVQRDTFTLIQAATGAVLVMPKSGVVSLRVRTPAALPARNGVGALAGGGVLTAVGSPVFITGVTFLALCPSCTSLHLPMLLIGGTAIGAGIPLLVRGARDRRAYREALQERALSPVVLRTPHGWTGGLRFRF